MDALKAGAAARIAASAARTAARRRHGGVAEAELEALVGDLQRLLDRIDRWLSLAERRCPPPRYSRVRLGDSGRCLLADALHLEDPCSSGRTSPESRPPH
jgi:hypothetical protein